MSESGLIFCHQSIQSPLRTEYNVQCTNVQYTVETHAFLFVKMNGRTTEVQAPG